MREIKAINITTAVKELFLKANYVIGDDILKKINEGIENDRIPLARNILEQIYENDILARNENVAMCQDTGMCVLFIEYGQEVFISGGNFEIAVNEGVRQAYSEGYLRKSVVDDPVFERINTKDNTPAVIHTKIVAGDKIKITVTAKGFGSENMSAVKMFPPAAGVNGVKEFVIQTVKNAGPNPCPPIVVGVGIGGTFEMACELAKRATIRPCESRNLNIKYSQLEDELLQEINNLGIGPAGLGGDTTALAVNVEYFPTHIAGMPVAVNICCHAARHAECEI